MAQFCTYQQVASLFPPIMNGKDPALVSQLITLASGEAERLCHRDLALTYHVDQTVVESGGLGTGRAMGGLGFAAVRADLPFYESWSPTTLFLQEMPISEVDALTLVYPHGGQGDLALDGLLLNGDEGWIQLPMGVYCPERTVAIVKYWAGYPQTTLALTANAGDTTVTVADARGINAGNRLKLYDYTHDEELIVIAQPNPGNGQSVLTLARALTSSHPVTAPVWGVPEILTTATAYFTADYLTTGTWPTNVPGGAALVKSGDLTMEMRGTGKAGAGATARGPLAATAIEMLQSSGMVRSGM